MSNQKPVSSCHNSPVKVVGGDEGTNHYECTECGKPCDPANQKPVDDKDTEQILDDIFNLGYAFAFGLKSSPDWRPDKDTLSKEEAIKALNAHYQKKYLGLIGEDEDGYKSPDWKLPHTPEMLVAYAEGWDKCKQYIREALANMEGE